MAAPALKLIDGTSTALGTSESLLLLENQHLRDEYDQLLRNYKGKCQRLSELERDRQAEAEADPLWPLAVRLFVYHSNVCNHPKAEWTAERFTMVKRLRRKRAVEEWLEGCLRAIAGVASDRWRMTQGLSMWEDVFETRKKYERALEKCPASWQPPSGAEAFLNG